MLKSIVISMGMSNRNTLQRMPVLTCEDRRMRKQLFCSRRLMIHSDSLSVHAAIPDAMLSVTTSECHPAVIK